MSNSCRLVVLLLLVMGVSSCKVESLDDPIIVPVVDQEFALELWQNLESSRMSPLEVRMYTLEDYECLNTVILSNYLRVGRNLELTLFDILDPEVCDPGLAPAVGLEELDNIDEDLYRLDIELQDVVSNLGWLTVTEDAYVIEMETENGISWLQNELRRIPENALWGFVTHTDLSSRQQAEALISDLFDLSSASDLEDGYYGYYLLSDNGTKVEVPSMSTQTQAETFLFKYEGALTEIDQRVEDFLANAPEGVELHFWDGKGNQWKN